MRNLPSALTIIAMVYLWINYGFHWIYFILLVAAAIFWGDPLVKMQMEELKARTENIMWNTQLAKTTTQLNLKTIAMMHRK